MELPEEKRQAIRNAIFEGRAIEAIKLVRESAGCGLKEAKDFVDSYSAELRQKEPEKFRVASTGRKGCAGLVLCGLLGLLTVIGLMLLN